MNWLIRKGKTLLKIQEVFFRPKKKLIGTVVKCEGIRENLTVTKRDTIIFREKKPTNW